MLISYLYFYLKFHRKSLHRLLLCLHLTSAVSLLLPYIVGRPWINWQLEFCYPFGGWSGWCSGSNSLKKKDIKMPFILFALLNAASFGLHSIKSFSALIFYADKKKMYIYTLQISLKYCYITLMLTNMNQYFETWKDEKSCSGRQK